VFSELALSLMKEVLKELEHHCLSRKCAHFPLVISTFSVLFMAVESIQYHAAKDPYHSSHDPFSVGTQPISTGGHNSASFKESEGVSALLHFYKACFSGCHFESLLSVATLSTENLEAASTSSSSAGFRFVTGLKYAIDQVKQYLIERSASPVTTRGGADITVFFDRLLARLFLLEP
jgi:hypothetical protein